MPKYGVIKDTILYLFLVSKYLMSVGDCECVLAQHLL